MRLNLKSILLSSLLIVNTTLANSKYLEYKMSHLLINGSFIYEEKTDKNKTEINGKITLSGLIPTLARIKEKNYKTIINGDKTLYEENEMGRGIFLVSSYGTDFLTTLRIFLKYAEGDSLEKHPLFKKGENFFKVYVDGEWRDINPSCFEKIKIKYNGKEIEAYHISLHGPDIKTQCDFFVYDKKIVKMKVKFGKFPFSLWGELQKNKE
jgi:hypothetical protein